MARIAVCVYSLALCAILLAGCRTGRQQAANPFARDTSLAPRVAGESRERPTNVADRTPRPGSADPFHAPTLPDGARANDPELNLTAAELAHLPEDERQRILRNVATMDPASAKIVIRTIRASSDLAKSAGSREQLGLDGGHSFGSRSTPGTVPIDEPLTRSDQRDPTAFGGIGEASAWADDPNVDHEGEHAAYRPNADEAERWPATRPEQPPAGPFDQLTGRLTGVLPTAASNATPAAVVAGDTLARQPGELRTPPPAAPRGTSPENAGATAPTDTGDRTMGGSFDTSPPPQRPLARSASSANGSATTPLEQLIDQLEQDTREAEPGDDPAARLAYIERHVFLRLMYIAAGDDRAFVAIPGLSPDEQTFWTNYLFATANYLDAHGIPDARDRAGQTVGQLRSAVRALQAEARLELRNVGFCTVIDRFGTYTPVEQTTFRPGKPVLIYAEVENFRSEITADGDYRTLLRSTIEFYRPDGTLLSKPIEFGQSEDRCRNHRRDYFLAFEFELPPDLPPGPQSMKVVVRDELSGRTDTHSLNYTVVP